MKNLAIISALLCFMCFLTDCNTGKLGGRIRAKQLPCLVNNSLDYDAYLNDLILQQNLHADTLKKPLVFVLKFHYVGDSVLDKEQMRKAIWYLNTVFAATKIRFRYKTQVSYIRESWNVDSLYFNAEAEKKLCRQYEDKRFVNVFVLEKTGDVLGYTHYPIMRLNRVFIHKNKLTEPAFVHEFGHFFGLLHTFENNLEEHIDHRNCDYAGDKICDTPADPFGATFVEEDCKLWGDYQDLSGNDFSPDMQNFMSYYGKCRSHFSTEQNNRMYFIAKQVKQVGLAM